jgi:hypothetical protein
MHDVNNRLQDGIATCRSVIANYRSLLNSEERAQGADLARTPSIEEERTGQAQR